MRFTTVLFLLIGSCLCLALAQVSYEDCCLKYVKTLSNATQKRAVRYRLQVPDGGCNLAAVIFTMRKGREFCTDPREKWVADLIRMVDTRGLFKPRTRQLNKHHSHRHRG